MSRDVENNKDAELFVELGRLVERYGSESFSRLAQLIKEPRTAAELAEVLEYAVSRTPRSKPVRRSRPRKMDRVGMSVLNELRLSDPKKHSILSDIRRQLVMGSILPTMSDIRQFALKHGLSIGKSGSRHATIAPLLRSMSDISTPLLASMLDDLVAYDPNDRSLERWRDVIVRPPPKAAIHSPSQKPQTR
jgi:hypothetical protein